MLFAASALAEETPGPSPKGVFRPLPKILCALYGSYVRVKDPTKSKAIRRRFEVKNYDECKQEVEDHCKFAEDPLKYMPGKLGGYFREGPGEPEIRFGVTKNCGVYREEKK